MLFVCSPPVLVSDVLWNYDDSDGPSASLMLARNETDLQKTHEPEDVQNAISLESLHLKTDTPVSKPLQQSVPPSAASLKEREAAYRAARERIFSSHEAKGNDTSAAKSRHVPAVAQRMIAHALGKRVEDPTERAALVKGKELVNGRTSPTSKEAVKHNSSSPGGGPYRNPSTRSRPTPTVSAETLKKEQTGAAKRMFAHALRLPGVEIPNGAARKPK
uniref:SUZ domain-containing protein n=1 Tax=Aegilops tauschii subsp. strangulata TaxID=200361 RepID=A0A453E1E5_AEGTS